MPDAAVAEPKRADPIELSQRRTKLAERAQRVFGEYLKSQKDDDGYQVADPKVVAAAFQKLGERMMADPVRMLDAQLLDIVGCKVDRQKPAAGCEHARSLGNRGRRIG